MGAVRTIIIWLSLVAVVTLPMGLAATNELLAWRDPIYIGAGFAGIIGLALLMLQPLLAAGILPRLAELLGRRIHRFAGSLLVIAVIGHVVGLWITSPPDVVDALLFRSPTSFSVWGVVAMWAVFATAILAIFRLNFRRLTWQRLHGALAIVIVLGTAIHAILIDGTMEPISKAILCALAIVATGYALVKLRVFVRPEKPMRAQK